MKVTRWGDYLLQLTRLTAINCFLVREDDGFTLVDTGLAGSADAILKAAREADGTIRRIVLTHAHSDHVGSLDALVAQLPEVEVLVGTREARLLAGDRTLDPDEPQTKLKGSYVQPRTQATRTLNAGDRVSALEVVPAPGHTPGQIALLDTRDGTLIAGDALQAWGGLIVAGMLKVVFPFSYFATWHRPTALETARRLAALRPSRLAVGHGNTVDHPLRPMEEAIRAAAAKFGA